jgi:hypothetical protein
MDHRCAAMTATDTVRIRRFRMLHGVGMVLNFVQLVAICFGLTIAL